MPADICVEKRSDLVMRECIAGSISELLLMKYSIGKYIFLIMAEANCLNTEEKMSCLLLKQDSTSDLKIQEILYNKGHLGIPSCRKHTGLKIRS